MHLRRGLHPLIWYADMVHPSHCKWIAYGADGLGGKGCTRMRPKLHLPVLGHAFRVTGVMALALA